MLNTLVPQTMTKFLVLIALTTACALENEAEKNKCNGPGDCLNGYSCVQGQCKPNGSGTDGSPSIDGDVDGGVNDGSVQPDLQVTNDGLSALTCEQLEAQFALKLDQTCTTEADCKLVQFEGHLQEPIWGVSGNCGIPVSKSADLSEARQIESVYKAKKCKSDVGVGSCINSSGTCCVDGKCVKIPVSEPAACPNFSQTCGNGSCVNSTLKVLPDGGSVTEVELETCYNCPQDCGSCCGDGHCQSYRGENKTTCPSDCN